MALKRATVVVNYPISSIDNAQSGDHAVSVIGQLVYAKRHM